MAPRRGRGRYALRAASYIRRGTFGERDGRFRGSANGRARRTSEGGVPPTLPRSVRRRPPASTPLRTRAYRSRAVPGPASTHRTRSAQTACGRDDDCDCDDDVLGACVRPPVSSRRGDGAPVISCVFSGCFCCGTFARGFVFVPLRGFFSPSPCFVCANIPRGKGRFSRVRRHR